MGRSFLFFRNTFVLFVFSTFLLPGLGFTSVVNETLEGDAKLVLGKIEEAEKHYANALKMDPGNWRVMRSLAEVKFKLEKYKETKELVDGVLGMEVIKRLWLRLRDIPNRSRQK